MGLSTVVEELGGGLFIFAVGAGIIGMLYEMLAMVSSF